MSIAWISRARLRALVGSVAVTAVFAIVSALPATASAAGLGTSTCQVAGHYKHVIFIQYDNTHLSRDIPNVPSDLQQVPALRNFLADNGTLESNQHTPLISHTADDIVTTESGLYPDRQGLAVSNSYLQYAPNSGAVPTKFPSAFTYWTDPVSSTDPLPNLITDGQKNAPAPWVSYTRAGCDVGAFSIANIELENTGTSPTGDITSVYGSGSPQWTFVNAQSGAGRTLAAADFEGIAVHCSKADSVNSPGHAGICSPQNGGSADKLSQEPGAPYSGFNGLFGAIYANQVSSKPGSFTASGQDANGHTNGNITDLAAPVDDVYHYSSHHCKFCANGKNLGFNGQPITTSVIADSSGNSGFPSGFDPTPAQTLGYVASMQEAGIPVTFAYIRDAHDNWSADNAFGPGEAGYVDQLKQENQAYDAFFERLGADGINKHNTLFVFTADEGDHFAGGTPSNSCNGVTTPCLYNHDNAHPNANSVGEQQAQINDELARQRSDTNPFAIHFDDAPNFYVGGPTGSTSPPGPTDPAVRQLEQDAGKLTLPNQITGATDAVTQHIADAVDQKILHMQTTDPLRTPSFTDFANPSYFFLTGSCPTGSTPGCPTVSDGHAWNHGGDQPEVTTTWLGIVGPTVRHLGQTGALWTDHTDTRPTMLALLGLGSDYQGDGAAVTQMIDPASLPAPLRPHRGDYQALQNAYSQLNAPLGRFGHDSELVSTRAAESSSPSDSIYMGFDAQLSSCDAARAPIASEMKADLNDVIFSGGHVDPGRWRQLVRSANALIADVHRLAGMATPPARPVCG